MAETDYQVVNVDKLTYAASLESLAGLSENQRYCFEKVDICDRSDIDEVLNRHRPNAVMHLAAESHVDRSVDDPAAFLRTNVVGTYVLLESCLSYWLTLSDGERDRFRFHHVSTDEVYGSLGESGLFAEESSYKPNSPYAASKAASDHFVRAWHRTYGLPIVLTNCSNNYGPYQFPEKFIPLMILNALEGRDLPVYGQGENVRDWLHVDDHVRGLVMVLEKGRIGETYNIGGCNEFRNIDVVYRVCDILDEMMPSRSTIQHRNLICFVQDRPGHDRRYAIDAAKITEELGWRPARTFDDGLRETVQWYLRNEQWWQPIRERYDRERLGLSRSAGIAAN